ncbi:MAG: AsmA family protein [Desulfobacteraceae bacterium]|nr:MAG: AsmA family protein [Desulfobacteraceae bacterium]
MSKAIKWLLIIVAGLVVIVLVAVLVAPMVINFDRYKPQIEAQASKALGRPVTVGGEIEPSVFPWIGVAVHDLHLGNPPGFGEEDFASIGLFEIRVKLWPLLFGEYEVKRFVVNDPRIVLIKQKDGRSNWEGLGGKTQTGPAPPPQGRPPDKRPLPIKDLAVGQFAITDGSLQYIDHAAGTRHEIKDIQVNLTDVSLNRPIRMDFSAAADGHPIRLGGMVGPVGSDPGKGPIDIDVTAELLDRIKIRMQGRVENPVDSPQAVMNVQVAPFSLRNVMADLKQPLPVEPADKSALTKLAFSVKLSGTPDRFTSEGTLTLDQSQVTFSAQATEFAKPNIQLEAALDRIDLDRYLPQPQPSEEKPGETPEAPGTGTAPPAKKTDYAPLRKLVMDAQIRVNELKVKNARTRNIALKAKANNGIIRIDPLNIDLYDGRISIASTINVQQDTPRSEADLSVSNVRAGPLLNDVMKKEFLEGVVNAAISLQMIGDQPDQIRRTLNGKGELKFNEGAIVGIDLAGMVRNVQSAFGLAEKPAEKPRTDFSELLIPFSIADGLAKLDNARLVSPLLRVEAGGNADLAQETLDIRVEPKFVATLKGQGDIKERAGIMVPVLVGGTFEKPKYRPDLKAILKQDLPDKETLKKAIPREDELKKGLEKKAQDLFKRLGPGGREK